MKKHTCDIVVGQCHNVTQVLPVLDMQGQSPLLFCFFILYIYIYIYILLWKIYLYINYTYHTINKNYVWIDRVWKN